MSGASDGRPVRRRLCGIEMGLTLGLTFALEACMPLGVWDGVDSECEGCAAF